MLPLAALLLAPPPGWAASPTLVADLDRKKTAWLYREELVPKYTLPDPLRCADGTRVTTAAEWAAKRRPETLELFRTHVYGRAPAGLTTTAAVTATEPAFGGTRKQVRITVADAAGKRFAFDATVYLPKADGPVPAPVPAVLLISHRPDPDAELFPAERILGRGVAAAWFDATRVDADKGDEASRAGGVRGVWPAGGGTPGKDSWGTLAAWAWAAGRVLDYLVTDPAIDPKWVGVVGHSRGGKTALWAAAEDQRFALGVSNNSGRGGASLYRRRFGEPAARIASAFPHWFCGTFRATAAADGELPIDSHQLVGLLAPRAAYVASADADLWADPRGEFLAAAAAGPVYALYGQKLPELMPPLDTPVVGGRVGYHVRTGGHALTAYDWDRYLDHLAAKR